MLRNKNTGTNEFRKLIEEIAMLMGYEALSDLPLEDAEIETPIETCMTPMIAGKKLAIVPVLRAGLGMVSGITALTPSAKIGHIGLYRDEVTHEPHEAGDADEPRGLHDTACSLYADPGSRDAGRALRQADAECSGDGRSPSAGCASSWMSRPT